MASNLLKDALVIMIPFTCKRKFVPSCRNVKMPPLRFLRASSHSLASSMYFKLLCRINCVGLGDEIDDIAHCMTQFQSCDADFSICFVQNN